MKRKHVAHILGFVFIMILLSIKGGGVGMSNPALPDVKRTRFFEIILGSEAIRGVGYRYEKIGFPLECLIVDVGSTEKAKGKMIGETDSDRDRRDIKTWRLKLDIAKLGFDFLVVGVAYCSMLLLVRQLLKRIQRIKRGH